MGDHGKAKLDISFAGTFVSSAFAACFAEVQSIFQSAYQQFLNCLYKICLASDQLLVFVLELMSMKFVPI